MPNCELYKWLFFARRGSWQFKSLRRFSGFPHSKPEFTLFLFTAVNRTIARFAHCSRVRRLSLELPAGFSITSTVEL